METRWLYIKESLSTYACDEIYTLFSAFLHLFDAIVPFDNALIIWLFQKNVLVVQ